MYFQEKEEEEKGIGAATENRELTLEVVVANIRGINEVEGT